MAATEFGAYANEQYFGLQEQIKYEGLTEDYESMVHSVVQVSLVNTFMIGSSIASVFTLGTDA